MFKFWQLAAEGVAQSGSGPWGRGGGSWPLSPVPLFQRKSCPLPFCYLHFRQRLYLFQYRSLLLHLVWPYLPLVSPQCLLSHIRSSGVIQLKNSLLLPPSLAGRQGPWMLQCHCIFWKCGTASAEEISLWSKWLRIHLTHFPCLIGRAFGLILKWFALQEPRTFMWHFGAQTLRIFPSPWGYMVQHPCNCPFGSALEAHCCIECVG